MEESGLMENELDKSSYIQSGDLIVFEDKHFLYCGDSTKETSYSFMQDQATMTLTSPPYNVGKNNYKSNDRSGGQKYLSKSDDTKSDDEYLSLMSSVLENALKHSKYVFWNIAHTSGNKIPLIDFTYKFKNNYVDTMIWAKKTSLPAMEPNVMNSDFEYIYIYSAIKNNGRHIRIGEDFRGTISNIIWEDRNMQNEWAKVHSALMPIRLAEKVITQFTKENDLVLDVFGGLATTLMACIKTNRRCYLIELQPLYCEKAIERYLDFCIKPNVKIIRNGETIPYERVRELCKKDQFNLFDFDFSR